MGYLLPKFNLLVNHYNHKPFIFSTFQCIFKNHFFNSSKVIIYLHIVDWYQVFLFKTNNFQTDAFKSKMVP